MTIIDYVLAQADARERAEERDGVELPPSLRIPNGVSIAGDLGGEPIRRVLPQRDARRKWVRAA